MIAILMWLMTGLAIIGFFLNMKLNKWGYIFWIVSNAGFVVNDIYAKQYPQAGLFAFYVVMCVVGFIQWSKKDADKKPKPHKTLVVLDKTIDKDFRKGDVCYFILGGGERYLIKVSNGKKKKFESSAHEIKQTEIGTVK